MNEGLAFPRTPKSLEIDITNRCNLRCSYCYHFQSPGDVERDLSTEEWLQFFEELNRCAVLRVTLSGGEPFDRRDFRTLVEGVVRNRMRFSVLSNGTLITRDWAEFLKSTRRCEQVQVSIDGPDPEVHDVFRGQGMFDRALAGLKCLRAAGVPAAVRVTLHRHNVKHLEEIARLLLEEVGLPSFSTNSACSFGLCQENQEQVQLTVEDQIRAMETLSQLKKKYNGRIGAQAGPLANFEHWSKMAEAHEKGRESLPACGYLRSCGGVFSKMGVRADGVMVPCTLLAHMELGRINQDSLAEVWQNHPELQRLRERRNLPLSVFASCAKCDYLTYCRGGCPANAYALEGYENVPSPDSCYRNFIEAGGVLPAKDAEHV